MLRRVAIPSMVVLLLAACTQIVGPARTYRDYELKASSTASGTFDGIQPPDGRAQALGDRLRDLLDPATAAVREVRIRARRTELGTPDPALERRLARSARALDRFEAAHT